MENDEKKNDVIFDKVFWITISIVIILIGIVCFFPYWFTTDSFKGIDFSGTGQIGDTIGGIMGPFIAIISSILTFIAFWVQYKANKRQNKQFDDQAKDIRIERFENKFYEMLRLHRANVEEIQLTDTLKGRESFKEMFNEFHLSYSNVVKYLQEFADDNKRKLGSLKISDIDKSDEQLRIEIKNKITNLAYYIFFFGVSSDHFSQERLKLNLYSEYDLDFLHYIFYNLTLNVKDRWSKKSSTYINLYDFAATSEKEKYETYSLTLSYQPLNGQQSRLGHYYRHLFQTVKFVVTQKDKFLNRNLKYDYLKTLRAQLSDFELLLLYYNGISNLGNDWISNGYFTEWRMIKNIPTHLASFGLIPEECFKVKTNSYDEHIFGWDEE